MNILSYEVSTERGQGQGPSALDVTPIDQIPTEQLLIAIGADGEVSFVPTYAAPPASIAGDGAGAFAVQGMIRSVVTAAEAAEAFERLLNEPKPREQTIQDFFEEWPDFLLGADYDRAFGQVVLPLANGDSLRPDFILRPLTSATWQPKIIELKLPTHGIVRPGPKNRPGMYAAVHDAVAQLRAYRHFFDDALEREMLSEQLGFEVHRPTLALVIGRSRDLKGRPGAVPVIDDLAPIQLMTYDDILARYRSLLGKRST